MNFFVKKIMKKCLKSKFKYIYLMYCKRILDKRIGFNYFQFLHWLSFYKKYIQRFKNFINSKFYKNIIEGVRNKNLLYKFTTFIKRTAKNKIEFSKDYKGRILKYEKVLYPFSFNFSLFKSIKKKNYIFKKEFNNFSFFLGWVYFKQIIPIDFWYYQKKFFMLPSWFVNSKFYYNRKFFLSCLNIFFFQYHYAVDIVNRYIGLASYISSFRIILGKKILRNKYFKLRQHAKRNLVFFKDVSYFGVDDNSFLINYDYPWEYKIIIIINMKKKKIIYDDEIYTSQNRLYELEESGIHEEFHSSSVDLNWEKSNFFHVLFDDLNKLIIN